MNYEWYLVYVFVHGRVRGVALVVAKQPLSHRGLISVSSYDEEKGKEIPKQGIGFYKL